MNMQKIHVLIADDHPVVRAGVRAFLEDQPDMLVVGEASNACQAIALAQEFRPDVAVLDISMPGRGLDATRQIRSTCPDTQSDPPSTRRNISCFMRFEPGGRLRAQSSDRTVTPFGLWLAVASFSTHLPPSW
jgi:PleD family two-component response regulator